ncbi:TPA: DUF1071 domain-containing protein [Enterococcus faecium]|nr:DUF1071 domain-containing protein [Enterococcus faecium]
MSEKEQPLKNRSDNTLFNSLYKINVKGVTEKRNDLTYLSWAWAWAEVSKVCEAVDYEIYRDPETHRPYLFDEKTGYMVFTSITVNGVKRDMWLPVMDGANKAMKDKPYTYEVNDYQWNNETKKKEIVGKIEKRVEAATMFDINKTIMRCLVKNLAMFGLGLYIFAGEDMPEDISMLEPATQRSKKLFLDALQLVANKYEKSIDEAIVALTDAASITADDSKWTKRDLGILKRGVNWLEDQYREETKEK